jgi:outer membrane protein TolC
MHDDSGAAYEIADNLDDLGPAGSSEGLEALQRKGVERRLDLRALEANRRSLQEQAKVARAGEWPRIDGIAEATYANPNPRIFPAKDEFRGSWSAGVALTWTPSDLLGASAQATGQDARAAAVAAQQKALADGIRVEVARAYLAEREAEKAIETSDRLKSSAEEAFRVRTVLFQNGRATEVELTDAETELTRARLGAIGSRVALHIARIELRHAAGLDVKPE